MPSITAETASRIRDNLARVRENIAQAAQRSGRLAESVKLVGVTKYVEPEIARVLVEAGLEYLGESRAMKVATLCFYALAVTVSTKDILDHT